VNLLRFLFRSGGRYVVLVAILGAISGLASSAFVAVVNTILHAPDRTRLVWLFAAVVFGRMVSTLVAQLVLARFSIDSMLRLCDELARRVIETPFRAIERLGPSRVMTTLTDDVLIMSAALQAIPAVMTNGAILVGCTIYLAVLSWKAALTLAVCAMAGAAAYQAVIRRVYGAVADARRERDVLFGHFRSITEGIKELQMNRARRRRLLETDIAASSRRLRALSLSMSYRYLFGDGTAQTIFFSIMGVMLFLLPGSARIPTESLTGYAFVALFVMGPIWALIGALPAFHRGQAAFDRINGLELALAQSVPEPASDGAPAMSGPAIEFRQVAFAYQGVSDGSGFVLGPIDLTVQRGEILFLIGGNGSGKSTFVKLLTGLYVPDSGEIRLNGMPIGPRHGEFHREQFSAVFSDFYLFASLVELGDDIDQRARRYLPRLDLDASVRIENGVLSTLALSQGQRRRLALLTAYLEDRPFYVFDEWAADQDPEHRETFYAQILPELKARGKTVVVITHDDRYFSLGDRVAKLDYGRIVDSWRPADDRRQDPLADAVLAPR
jgi:putative ATP-binding cassette transporter